MLTPRTFLAVDLLIAAVLLGQPGCVSVTVHQQDGALALRAPGPGCLWRRGQRATLLSLLPQMFPTSVQTPQATGETAQAETQEQPRGQVWPGERDPASGAWRARASTKGRFRVGTDSGRETGTEGWLGRYEPHVWCPTAWSGVGRQGPEKWTGRHFMTGSKVEGRQHRAWLQTTLQSCSNRSSMVRAQRQTHRWSERTDSRKWSHTYRGRQPTTRGQDYSGERQLLQQTVLGKPGPLRQKNQTGLLSYKCHKRA